MDTLFDMLVRFATEMLKKRGGFQPFGASMDMGGKVACVAGYTGEELPEGQEVIELLTDGFRDAAGEGKIKACGICYDGRVIAPGQTDKADAICTHLEHREAEPVDAFILYRKRLFRHHRFGKPFAGRGEAKVFVNSGDV